MQWVHNFQLFLFDFDGLLVDTECVHYQAYCNMMRQFGYTLDWSFSRYCEMAHCSASAIREGLYAQFPSLNPDWELVYSMKKQCYQELLAAGCIQLMPGVKALLEVLEKAHIRRCVVTHSPMEQTELIRSQLPILRSIPYWVTREQYDQPKPCPECYLKAIALYGREGDRIIGFEDSMRGLQALRETSAIPVLICPSHHPLLELALAGGGIHFESFEQIPKDRLGSRLS